jgi:hypothetical protein
MTSLLDTHVLEAQLLARLGEDVECLAVGEGRLGCLTPLEYPNGDSVTVWVQAHGSVCEVTDFGEATPELPNKGKLRRAVDEHAAMLARGRGVEFVNGRVTVRCEAVSVADHIWDVALASAQVAQLVADLRRRLPEQERERAFATEVERTLRKREVVFERAHKLEGRSGHTYNATIFLPNLDAVIEPVGGHWNQVAATYVKFGDLSGANGYKLYSLLDDRSEPPEGDVSSLLVQVSSVVAWSRRDDWLNQIA